MRKKIHSEENKTPFVQMMEKMKDIEKYMCKAVKEIEELHDLREEIGDDLYFQVLSETPELRTAFDRFFNAAKFFKK